MLPLFPYSSQDTWSLTPIPCQEVACSRHQSANTNTKVAESSSRKSGPIPHRVTALQNLQIEDGAMSHSLLNGHARSAFGGQRRLFEFGVVGFHFGSENGKKGRPEKVGD